MNFDLNLSDINYIKILYKDENDFSHCTKASIKSMTDCDIYACAKKDEWEKIPAPQNIIVSFASDNGLYRANSILKYTKYEEPFLYMALKTPKEVEFQQKREYFRVHIGGNIVISYRCENEVKRVSAKISDISANGICVVLPTEIHFPKDVFIDIYLAGREIRTKAKFVRTDTEDDIIKSSFNYINLAESDIDYISRVCIKKQIEDKRSSLE